MEGEIAPGNKWNDFAQSLQQKQLNSEGSADTATSTESPSVVGAKSAAALQITMDHDQGIDMTLVNQVSVVVLTFWLF